MASKPPGSAIPPPVQGPTVPVDPAPKTIDDYNLPPEVTDADLAKNKAPVTNTPLPNPSILDKVHNTPPSNNISLKAARPGDPESYIFGRCVCEPTMVAVDDSGDFLVMDLLWGVGEIDYFEGLIVDNVFEGRADQLGKMQHFTGASGQVASSIMAALKGGTYDALPGKAHSVVSWFTGWGLDIKGRIRGLKLWDPRLSPAANAYSTNPALALARVFTACGYTMNWPSVAAAANYTDETIGSPAVKRWEIGGQIINRVSLKEIVHTLQAYASCFVDRIGGEIYLIPDAPGTANHTVTADDMIAESVRVTRYGGKNVPTAVRVIGKDIDGNPLPYTYGTPGGAGTVAEYNMPMFQRIDMVGRKAEEIYQKARSDLVVEFIGFDDSILRTVGDIGTVTNAAFDISSEPMRLIQNDPVSRGRWFRKYVSYNAGNYSDVIYTSTTNVTTLYNPYRPPAGPTPTVTEELFTDADGVTYSRFKIDWTGISWAYLQDYRVTVEGGDQVILDTHRPKQGTTTHTTYTSEPLTSGVTYTVSVYVHSNVDAYSSNPGTAEVTSSAGNNALLNEGDLTNMHVYTLDGDGRYATTSPKTGSPQQGITWAQRFGDDSPQRQAWAAGETWLGDQVCETIFETEVFDTGQTWSGQWRFVDLNVAQLGGATRANYVSLSDDVSPLAFVDQAGTSYSDEARFMKAKMTVADSPLSAGLGLHVKLPIQVTFLLGN